VRCLIILPFHVYVSISECEAFALLELHVCVTPGFEYTQCIAI